MESELTSNRPSIVHFTEFVLIAAGIALAGSAHAERIRETGSDTMLPLAQQWAKTYMAAHPDVAIDVTGGGSSTGIAALIEKTTDIANASRAIRAPEVSAAAAAGIETSEIKVAMGAVVVIVHKDNPIEELTVNQVKAIFTGAINNWEDFGGLPQRILRYGRETSSGTYAFFKENALANKEFAADCRTMLSPATIDSAVGSDPAAIGYGPATYSLKNPMTKVLKIKSVKDAPAFTPVTADGKALDLAVIHSGNYALTRSLYCYTAGAPKGAVASYLDWIVGPEGQRIAADMGFAPLPTGAGSGGSVR